MATKKTTTKGSKGKKSFAPDKGTKRPNPNPGVPSQAFERIGDLLSDVKTLLEDYTANLRPLDRKRLNGVGIKKQGFVHRAYDYAVESPEFLPSYLPIEKFKNDEDYFNSCRVLYETCKQIQGLLWNLTLQAADVVYTDALEYYASVREAKKRRIDGAESIYRDLEAFFRKKKAVSGEPTEKEIKRDLNALLHSKRDGKIVVESRKPQVIGGKRKVVDEKFATTKRFKEMEEGEIDE